MREIDTMDWVVESIVVGQVDSTENEFDGDWPEVAMSLSTVVGQINSTENEFDGDWPEGVAVCCG